MENIIAIIAALDISGIAIALLAIVGGAATLAAMTPTPKDDIVLAKIKKVLDFVAMNIGQAKNKDSDE